jgi:hypothetical protein
VKTKASIALRLGSYYSSSTSPTVGMILYQATILLSLGTLVDLAAECHSDDSCQGFNTYGYASKRKVLNHQMNWHREAACNGFYTKLG